MKIIEKYLGIHFHTAWDITPSLFCGIFWSVSAKAFAVSCCIRYHVILDSAKTSSDCIHQLQYQRCNPYFKFQFKFDLSFGMTDGFPLTTGLY